MRKFQTGKKRPEISRQVKCVETGEVFESITAAAKWCNVHFSNLVALLKGKGRTAGGYHWIYANEDEEAALERIRQMPEGRQRTEESKEKQRKAMTGRKHTPEHCAKKSANLISGRAGSLRLMKSFAEKFSASKLAKPFRA